MRHPGAVRRAATSPDPPRPSSTFERVAGNDRWARATPWFPRDGSAADMTATLSNEPADLPFSAVHRPGWCPPGPDPRGTRTSDRLPSVRCRCPRPAPRSWSSGQGWPACLPPPASLPRGVTSTCSRGLPPRAAASPPNGSTDSSWTAGFQVLNTGYPRVADLDLAALGLGWFERGAVDPGGRAAAPGGGPRSASQHGPRSARGPDRVARARRPRSPPSRSAPDTARLDRLLSTPETDRPRPRYDGAGVGGAALERFLPPSPCRRPAGGRARHVQPVPRPAVAWSFAGEDRAALLPGCRRSAGQLAGRLRSRSGSTSAPACPRGSPGLGAPSTAAPCRPPRSSSPPIRRRPTRLLPGLEGAARATPGDHASARPPGVPRGRCR